MDLKLKDVAELLNVSTSTIRRWLAEGKMPAYRINQQYRFNRLEIENWVMRHRSAQLSSEETVPVRERVEGPSKGGIKQFSLYRAINKGGVLRHVPGPNKESVIRASTKQIAKSLHLDAEVLGDLLLDRERLMPTALNNGIGVPHTRDFLLSGPQDVVAVAFPDHPIQYGSLDGQPVHTLFFLFACNDRHHLHLLAKIAHLASHPATLELLKRQPTKEELLSHIRDWEAQIQQVEEEIEEESHRH